MIGGAVQTREGRIRETHPLKPLLIHGNLEYQQCSPKQFKEAQTQDPSLDRFFEWAKEPFQGNNSQVKWFEMDGDLLVRRYKRPEDGILLRQVLVPKKLRNEVLIIIIIIKSIYKAPCLRVIKPAQRRYTKVHNIPE